MKHLVVAVVAAFVLSLPAAVGAQTPATPAAQAPVREISKIAGEVYRFRNNNHFSVFAVTSAGIIATDPINAAAASWLKDELKKRWPDKAIKFVVYSHDHADHISGGEVWADTATVVAHDNAKDPLEFDILAPGHGPLGSKADVTAFRNYLQDLRAQVLAAARAGKTLEETKKLVDLSKYKDWAGYEQMSQLNIEGVYRLVQATRRPNQ